MVFYWIIDMKKGAKNTLLKYKTISFYYSLTNFIAPKSSNDNI